jgi:uncharacterized DUF497 family protein/DNA-binding transcriptional regulator YiaG
MRDDEFEWDDKKALTNERDHGVTFDLARHAFETDDDWFEFDDPDPDEPRYNRLCVVMVDDVEVVLHITYTERGPRIRIISARKALSHEQRTTTKIDPDTHGMTAESRHRLKAQTDAEVMSSALADPDAQPATAEQLARGGRPLVKVVRQKLRMGQEEFAAAYGIPLDALVAWERRQAEPTATETAYLRLIERNPEGAKLIAA